MRTDERGITYLELVATAAIVMILASAVLPLTRITHKRMQEIELRRALRTIRNGIDAYAKAAVDGKVCGTDLKLNNDGFPADLEVLVKGVNWCGMPNKKLKFLRQIPVDPMTGKNEWGMRCHQDDADNDSWCGDNVWDVYSKSEGKALDGTKYREW
jgi:general secretion pathway protein G